eukprot:scaffold17587_cov91-Phaeocystis_antarctica.AAC.3
MQRLLLVAHLPSPDARHARAPAARARPSLQRPPARAAPAGAAQRLRCRGVLLMLGHYERRPAGAVLQRGVGLGFEQRLHDRGVAIVSSGHQGGEMEAGFLQVDARAALQQHPHHRLLPSRGGRRQQRRVAILCAARIHAAALVQPRSHGLRTALVRCKKNGSGQRRRRVRHRRKRVSALLAGSTIWGSNTVQQQNAE